MNSFKTMVRIFAVAGSLFLVIGVILVVTQRQPKTDSGPGAALEIPPSAQAPTSRDRSNAPSASVANNDGEIRDIIDRMNSQALRDAPPTVYLAESGDSEGGRTGSIVANGKAMGLRMKAPDLLAWAYGTSRTRLRLADGVQWPAGRFNYLVSIDSGQREALREVIREKLGLSARPATQDEDVYVLRARQGEFDHRRPSESEQGGTRVSLRDGGLNLENATIDAFVRSLEPMLPIPVVDESGLRGRFDISLTTDAPLGGNGPNERPKAENILRDVSEQLGFDLSKEKRPMDVLVVEASRKG